MQMGLMAQPGLLARQGQRVRRALLAPMGPWAPLAQRVLPEPMVPWAPQGQQVRQAHRVKSVYKELRDRRVRRARKGLLAPPVLLVLWDPQVPQALPELMGPWAPQVLREPMVLWGQPDPLVQPERREQQEL